MSRWFVEVGVASGDLTARAEELVPVLSRNAAETEAGRSMAGENIRVLEDADLFRMTQPRRHGGQETEVSTVVRVLSELGRGCASTAWVVGMINGFNWLAGCMSDEARAEFWGEDPTARFCGALADFGARCRPIPDGHVLTGEWRFAAGSAHADWALLGHPALGPEGEPTETAVSAVPMSELEVVDTWFAAGLGGTASNTVTADEVFVPRHRTLSLPDVVIGRVPNQHRDEALYRSALSPVMALIAAGPQLGIVRGAVAQVSGSLAEGHPIENTNYGDSRRSPSVQLGLADAQQELDTAMLLVERGSAAIDRAALAGIFPGIGARARVRMDAGRAVTHLRAAMQHLLDLGGVDSFDHDNPLQRMWRDLETASRHPALSPLIAREAYGRVLAGIEEPVTPLL